MMRFGANADRRDRKRTGLQLLTQRLAVDQLHGDVGLAVGFADLMYRTDMGMVEGRRRPCFLKQPGPIHRVLKGGRRQNLNRDFSVQLIIMGAIHFAHITRAELVEYSVVCECRGAELGRGHGFGWIENLDPILAPGD